MPLPKLPTRPAAILTFPRARTPGRRAAAPRPPLRGPTRKPPLPRTTTTCWSSPSWTAWPPGRPWQVPDSRARPPGAAARPAAPAARAERPVKAAPAPAKRAKARAQNAPRKLFVLDTNVLLHDPSSLFRFEEHDIFLPMMTLEELDHQKKGMSEVARNARQVSRSLDALVQDAKQLDDGLELSALGNKDATGRLMFQTTAIHSTLPSDLPMGKADNQILAWCGRCRRSTRSARSCWCRKTSTCA